MKWIGLMVALLLIYSCFMPWVTIEAKHITVSGVDATGTYFGKPGYFHFLMVFFFILFNFIPKIWAKRLNILVAALNMGWAIRNFIIVSVCSGGECPEKQVGLYLVLFASILLLVASFFPNIKVEEDQ